MPNFIKIGLLTLKSIGYMHMGKDNFICIEINKNSLIAQCFPHYWPQHVYMPFLLSTLLT